MLAEKKLNQIFQISAKLANVYCVFGPEKIETKCPGSRNAYLLILHPVLKHREQKRRLC